jgi:hypothetical protein
MRRAVGVSGICIALSIAVPGAKADAPPDDAVPPLGNPGGLGVGMVIGTTGVGGELSVRPFSNVVLRAGGWFALDHDFSADSNTYKLKADMISVGATLDWHPFANGFRLSAGGRYHNLDMTGSASASGATIDLNGTTYLLAATGPITASVKSSNTVAPYLGLGYDSTHFSESRWAIALDLGVIYSGMPTTSLTAQNAALIPGLQADLDAEKKKFDDSVGKYGQFWPVASLALKYRF